VNKRDDPQPLQFEQVEPEYYRQFHCLAEACPDTCCDGWRVGIDKATYSLYRRSSDPVLAPKFQELVIINPARTSDDHYAVFATSGGRCAFLSEGLCSIQQRLGESYLGAACASFPRVTNLLNGVLERSLDLACPEAARLALTNPAPLEFSLIETDPTEHRAALVEPSHGRLYNSAFSDAQVMQVRKFIQRLLQNRKYPVAKRLVLLGHVCDKLNEIAREGNYESTQTVLEGFACTIDAGLFDEHLSRCTADPATQLGIVLDLIAERVKSDFTHRRFLEVHDEFLKGIRWAPEMTLRELGAQYAEAYRQFYIPAMSRHESVLEHYLVNNAFKALFPFGSQSLNRALNLEPPRAIMGQYILMASYFAILKAMLIGAAGYHGAAFSLDVIVRTVQICSKTFEHSVIYPKRILEILASKGITNSAGMAVLTQN
jgi:lysine-N-methylase